MFIRFPNLPAGDCLLDVQLVYTVSKPTCRGLSAVGADCLYGFQTYLQGTVGWRCSLFTRFPNLPAGDCRLEVQLVYTVSKPTCRDCLPDVQPVYTVSKPTCRGLTAGGAACCYGFQTFLQGTVCRLCSLFIRFPSLPAGDCLPEVQPVYTVSKPTCRDCLPEVQLIKRFPNLPAGDCLLEVQLVNTVFKPYCRGLSSAGAACLYGFQTYLQRTVCWKCSFFIRFPNLPAGDCLLEVQPVYTVSKPTCRGLSVGGAACLYGFQTYLQGTVGWRCSLFIRFPNLPAGDCGLEVQPVYTVSKPTCRGLSAGGAACLYGFRTSLQGTVGWRCSLFIRFPNLPAGDCRLEEQPVFMVSKPTSRRLLAMSVACLYGFGTYLKGPVLLRSSLCIKFPILQYLPTRPCRPEVQPGYIGSEQVKTGCTPC